MQRRGFIEGQNLTVEFRAYGQHVDLIPQYAAELVKARVDVIAASGDETVRALQQPTKTIPIVAMVSDMLGSGLVTSLARPDGNTTGVSILTDETDGKRQDILIEAVPGLRLMAVLTDVNFTSAAKLDVLQAAARAHRIQFFNSSCHQRRGDRRSYRQCAGIGCYSAKHCVVTALPRSSAPHYGARRRGDHPQCNVAALQLFSQSRTDELNFPSPGPDLESTLFWSSSLKNPAPAELHKD